MYVKKSKKQDVTSNGYIDFLAVFAMNVMTDKLADKQINLAIEYFYYNNIVQLYI